MKQHRATNPRRFLFFAVAVACLGCDLGAITSPSDGFHIVDGTPSLVLGSAVPMERMSLKPRIQEIAGADAATFRALSKNFALDHESVYVAFFDGTKTYPAAIKGADPESFETIDERGWYSKDDRHVYYMGLRIKNADPSTFQIVDGAYSRDAKSVFLGPVHIEGAIPDSFHVTESGVFANLWRGKYRPDQHPESSDPAEVELSGRAKDGKRHYVAHYVLKGADYDSFVWLDTFYAKDKDRCYYCSPRRRPVVIAGADAATFETVGATRAKDKNHEYLRGVPD